MLRSADCAGAPGVRGDGAEQKMGQWRFDNWPVSFALLECDKVYIPSLCFAAEALGCGETMGGRVCSECSRCL